MTVAILSVVVVVAWLVRWLRSKLSGGAVYPAGSVK
jgi:hypothetical protein